MPNEHPMMSREEYERRFPDFPAGDAAPRQDRLEDIAADWGYPGCDEGVRWLIEEVARLRLSGDGTPPTDGLYTRLMDIIGERFPETQVQSTLRSRIAYLMQQVEVSRGRAGPAEGERQRYINESSQVLASPYAFQDTPQGKYARGIFEYFRDYYAWAALRDGGQPKDIACPVCRSEKVEELKQTASHTYGETVRFPDEFSRCGECGEEFYTREQSRAHTNAFRKAARGGQPDGGRLTEQEGP